MKDCPCKKLKSWMILCTVWGGGGGARGGCIRCLNYDIDLFTKLSISRILTPQIVSFCCMGLLSRPKTGGNLKMAFCRCSFWQ